VRRVAERGISLPIFLAVDWPAYVEAADVADSLCFLLGCRRNLLNHLPHQQISILAVPFAEESQV